MHIAVGQFDIPTLDRGPSPGFWGVDRSVGTCALQTEAIRAIIKVVIYAFIMCSLFFGLVAGFHLPCRNAFHLQVAAFAEEADLEILGFIVMPSNGGLAVVGKDLDQVFVDKDT